MFVRSGAWINHAIQILNLMMFSRFIIELIPQLKNGNLRKPNVVYFFYIGLDFEENLRGQGCKVKGK